MKWLLASKVDSNTRGVVRGKCRSPRRLPRTAGPGADIVSASNCLVYELSRPVILGVLEILPDPAALRAKPETPAGSYSSRWPSNCSSIWNRLMKFR